MKKRVITVLLTVGLLVSVFASVALAGQQDVHCGPSYGFPPLRAYLHENSRGDTSDGDDRLAICFQNSYSTDLWISHTPPGDCHGNFVYRFLWLKCVSSVTTWLAAGQAACFYETGDYSGPELATIVGPTSGQRVNIPSDRASSVKFTSGSIGC